ncbi:hypothetical protein K6U54_07370 [Vibrio alginolyticus]|uniref:hypothetical protein n=1 Tax=Vibrio alginolyticus TaxID=663 RepID=UPI001EEABCC2|nr:hypothetical protein [Vibrio alginolyticus]MCG6322145.1 hypothetical protein [Vibrio alginolyticus]
MNKKKKTPLKFPNPVNSNPSHDAEHVIYVAGLKSAKNNKAAIGKPIAEYMLVRDGIGNVEKGAFNCLTGALQR